MTARLSRFVDSMRDAVDQDGRPLELDALLVVDETNVQYLTGFTGDSTWLWVPAEGPATLLSDRRYESQLAGECPDLVAAIRPPEQSLVQLLADVTSGGSTRRVGFEADHVSVAAFRSWNEELPEFDWVPTSQLVERLRAVKDDQEVHAIRRAVEVAERSFLSVMHQWTPRMTEREVAHELEATMRRLGASGVSFPPIVGVQPNGALPHYRPGDVPLGNCPTLLVDWGAMVDGYASDLTRTLHRPRETGAASDRFRSAYSAVLEAQQAAIETIADGVSAAEVDRAARRVLENSGLGEAFKHSLGHGIGRQIHERPRLSPQSEDTLVAGMVVTVEPGVYFEGEFGIRIEDDVLVTTDGCRLLGGLPKGLDDCPLVM